MTATKTDGWQERFAKYLVGNVNPQSHEQRGYCPLCEKPGESGTPSSSFNWAKKVFNCFHDCGGYTFADLWNAIDEDDDPPPASRSTVRSIDDAKSRRGRGQPLPTEEEIQDFVDALLAAPTRLAVMKEKRGLTLKTIRKYQIGWHDGRYTIPVRDADGVLVNVRRYKADAKNPKDKMVSWSTGSGEGRLFLPEVLAEDEVIITEGEMDALIGQQHGFPCMSHTSGASVWKSAWSVLFEGKTVFICYDVDDAGKQGARKVAFQLSKVAKAVYLVTLPLTRKGDDLTNYFVDQGYAASDFRSLLDQSRRDPWGADRRRTTSMKAVPKDVTLEHSQSGEHGGEPLQIVATVAGKVQPAYVLPKRMEGICGLDWGDRCHKCVMETRGGQHTISINADDGFLLELIDKSKEQAEKAYRKLFEAPPTCPRLDINVEESYSVEELILVPAVDERKEEVQTPIDRRVYNVGQYATPINSKVRFVGVNTSDPRTQRGVLQTWFSELTQTDLDRFVMTPELREKLLVFQPRKGQSPVEKMEAIALDLEANVTKIYGRPELHMAYDLVWHSLMDFSLKGTPLGKGWLELLVVGDTRTGKSEAALRLIDHYNAGVLKSCEGATLAGLVGGAQQSNSSWMVRWGTIPLNDRRLVVLDEFSGLADKNVIEQMSSVRSSGRAQITKIVSQETSARTRLIWISNPDDGRAIEEMNLGAIEAIRSLIKNPEDIARFDMAMSAARADVDSAVINSRTHQRIKHRYTRELCSALVSWAWSRKAEHVTWQPGVENYLLNRAEDMGQRYIPEPPLVQAENVRVKLARIAAAVAARTFSCDETGNCVVITEDHVDAAEEILERLYRMPSFGYALHSRKVLRDRERSESNRRQCRQWLTVHRYDAYVALQACMGGPFKVRDFCEFGGMDQDAAQAAVRELQEMKMVQRMSKGYMKMNPALVEVLKWLEDKWESEE